jgi:hypothetical protein
MAEVVSIAIPNQQSRQAAHHGCRGCKHCHSAGVKASREELEEALVGGVPGEGTEPRLEAEAVPREQGSSIGKLEGKAAASGSAGGGRTT